MRPIKHVIIHCSASPNFQHVTIEEIDRWHKQRGFYRSNPVINPRLLSIGYHFVIYVDGSVHAGRDVSEVGAHAAGWNAESIGVCMVGNDQFTSEQWDALKKLVSRFHGDYGPVDVCGHCDLPNVKKTCPNFNVYEWWANNFMGGSHNGN